MFIRNRSAVFEHVQPKRILAHRSYMTRSSTHIHMTLFTHEEQNLGHQLSKHGGSPCRDVAPVQEAKQCY